MSKNFELLYHISNEKGLFETLEGLEEVSEPDPGAQPNPEIDGKAKTLQQASLPDVFRPISETLGPLDPWTAPLDVASQPGTKERHKTPGSTAPDGRFPISRNPLTRMGAAPAWDRSKIDHEIGLDLGSELRLQWERDLSRGAVVPNTPGEERTASSIDSIVQPPPPREQEKAAQEPSRSPTWPPQLFLPSFARPNQSAGRSRSKQVRTRGVYKDGRREQMAREEESKLIQRVFLREGSSTRVALFAGLEPDSGCAAISVRAAETLAAQAEGTVCLVDADFETASLHEYFDLPNGKGLVEATEESGPIQEFARHVKSSNLWLVPCGYGSSPLDSAKSADQLRARLEELRNAYGYVVVHSGPLWLRPNAMHLGKWTDGVVLILEANATRRELARRIKESLAVANAKVLGVVLNNRSYPIPEALYTRL